MNRNTFIFRSVVLTAVLMCAISVSAQRYGNMMGGGMGGNMMGGGMGGNMMGGGMGGNMMGG
ncbi:MAG: hypothetical protein VCB81_05235, partial [Verrucomicrobiia bacterium]